MLSSPRWPLRPLLRTFLAILLLLAVSCAAGKLNFQIPAKNNDQSNSLSWALRAFRALDSTNNGYVVKSDLLNHFAANGLMDHHALEPIIRNLSSFPADGEISLQHFTDLERVSDLFF